MLIIGIDPGPEMSAAVDLRDGAVMNAEYMGNVKLARELNAIRYSADTQLAIEYPEGRGMATPQSVLDTCLWCGRFDYNLNGKLYHPRDIRAWFCGTSKCNRSHVTQAIKDRYGEVGTKKNPGPLYLVGGPHKTKDGASITGHLWDAAAVAFMHYEKLHAKGDTK